MSFYRKYRPQVIDEIDNLAVRERLLSFLTKDKKELPHAYLFSGPRGAGKTTSARLIAKLFNCEKPSKNGPCGACEQCTTIATGRHMDVLEIDAASNRGIDEMRQLRESIGLAPSTGKYKIYIIDEVHMLTTEAFNALLKTLEEPPAHAVFILATTDPQKVPATIKSRCVQIIFSRATDGELAGALGRIAKEEKLKVDKDALALLSTYADGSFRDGVKLLEQMSFHEGAITADVVRSLLSAGDETLRHDFLKHLAQKDTVKALGIVDGLVKDGKDIKQFLIDCLRELEQLLLASVIGKASDVWGADALRNVVRKLTTAYSELKASPLPQLPLELAIVEFCQGQNDSPAGTNEKKEEKKEPTVVLSRDAQAAVKPPVQKPEPVPSAVNDLPSTPIQSGSTISPDGMISLEKLTEHWRDVIESIKAENTSIAGVLRSTRPKGVADGIVTIEAFYSFHKDKLSEPKVKDLLASTLKKSFGEKVKVEIVLGKK